jgi:hypothetical protein
LPQKRRTDALKAVDTVGILVAGRTPRGMTDDDIESGYAVDSDKLETNLMQYHSRTRGEMVEEEAVGPLHSLLPVACDTVVDSDAAALDNVHDEHIEILGNAAEGEAEEEEGVDPVSNRILGVAAETTTTPSCLCSRC